MNDSMMELDGLHDRICGFCSKLEGTLCDTWQDLDRCTEATYLMSLTLGKRNRFYIQCGGYCMDDGCVMPIAEYEELHQIAPLCKPLEGQYDIIDRCKR